MADKIKCPKCGTQISIDEAIVQKMVALRVQKQIEEEKNKWQEDFSREQKDKIKILEERFISEKKKREEAEEKELKLRLREEELRDREKKIELEIARKSSEKQKELEEKISKEAHEKYQLILAEKDKKIEDQKKLNEEMNRKLHQGSMQTQGEVLELTLEEHLKKNFPTDKIQPVPKGISGADIIQTVYDRTGQPAGMIAWESKRTKNWTEEWVQKLKDDARAVKANIAVLVSEVLPKEINHIGYYQGIWVSDFPSSAGLASALRSQLLAVSNSLVASTGKDQKMESLYNYLTSDIFAQRVQALVETFINMRTNLSKEKVAMERIWAARETQLLRLTENTAKMYGEIEGIAGKSLPNVELLELESGVEKEEKKPEKESSDQSSLFS